MPQPILHHNLAARVARWSGRHRKVAIFGWLGLMAMLFAFSLVSPMNMIVSSAAPSLRPATRTRIQPPTRTE